jgi:hypothetical protein
VLELEFDHQLGKLSAADFEQLSRGFSDIGVGSVSAGKPWPVSFALSWPVLDALSKPSDNVSNVAGTRRTPSASVRHTGTRHSDEALLDQLNCVQREEQALGAVETLETAHGS